MNKLRLQPPEGVSFSFLLASPISRMLAVVLDAAAVAALAQTFNALATVIVVVSPDFSKAVIIIGYFILSILYGIVLEYAWRGQTLGKRLLRLRVIDTQGLRLTLSQVVMRNLLRFVDMLPFCYCVGGTVCLFSRRFQRLGDIAANTIVIRHQQSPEPALDTAELPEFNSLRKYPHLIARLRQRVTPAEAGVLLNALLRRDQFEPGARVELFAELAEYCRGIVPFPAETMEAITDEQIVRNVVDVVFENAK